MTRLSASLYAADPFRLAEELEAIAPYVESLHLDVMDGMFTPDFGLNARLIGELAARTELPLDVHLMIRDPRRVATRYSELGVRSIAVHVEENQEFSDISRALRGNGVKAIAALRHSTDVAELERLGHDADGFLFLTAPAGGGSFEAKAFERLAARPRGLPVIVDGRIEPEHFDRLRALDVDLAVVGATLFASGRTGRRAAELAAGLGLPSGRWPEPDRHAS